MHVVFSMFKTAHMDDVGYMTLHCAMNAYTMGASREGAPPPDFVMLQNFKHQITCITM